jgi:hypothetical protein
MLHGKSFLLLCDSHYEFRYLRCIHCKAIEPLIMDLADRLKEDPYFQIYRIDGSKNEINYPGFKVYGFPTIYLLPPVLPGPGIGEQEAALQRKPVLFDEDRTIDALLEFVKSNRVDVVEYIHKAQVGETTDSTNAASEPESTPSEVEEAVSEETGSTSKESAESVSDDADTSNDTSEEAVATEESVVAVDDSNICAAEGTCSKGESLSENTDEAIESSVPESSIDVN